MKSNPLVSVIIPTYNRAHIVCRAIESVLRQTYKNREIIVVDDGSTDNTLIQLRAYDDRIRILSQKNGGPTIARNCGIRASTGEIIAFLDSDDYWLPTKLARQVELLEKAGPSVPCCLCSCTVVYNDGTRSSTFKTANIIPRSPGGLWLNPTEVLLSRFVLFNQAVAIRRNVLDCAGFFDESFPFFSEDYELALRLSLEGPWAVIADDLVVRQDASPGSLTQRALQEEIQLCAHFIRIWEGIAARIEQDRRDVRLLRLVRRELHRTKRKLAWARLGTFGFLGADRLSSWLRSTERYRSFLYRKSPFYPKVIIQQLG
jgi:glycosyltransferase involved in cell wall biosynthesis